MEKRILAVKVGNALLNIWGCSPILALSDDNDYPGIQMAIGTNEKNERRICLSLINIMCGLCCIRLISIFFHPFHIDFFRIHSLERVIEKKKENSDEYINKLKEEYEHHVDTIKQNARLIEKESLLRHLSDENERIEKSFSKVNIYSSLILMVLAVVVPISIGHVKILNWSILQKTLFFLEFYILWNLGWLVFQTYKVQGYKKTRFNDLKKTKDDRKEIVYLTYIYYDWQQIKRKADTLVTCVQQFQDWIIGGLIIGLLFMASLINLEIQKPSSMNTGGRVYNLNLESISETYSSDAIQFSEIQLELQRRGTQDVIVLYAPDNEMRYIVNILDDFKKHEVRYIKDESLETDQVKIILGD